MFITYCNKDQDVEATLNIGFIRLDGRGVIGCVWNNIGRVGRRIGLNRILFGGGFITLENAIFDPTIFRCVIRSLIMITIFDSIPNLLFCPRSRTTKDPPQEALEFLFWCSWKFKIGHGILWSLRWWIMKFEFLLKD